MFLLASCGGTTDSNVSDSESASDSSTSSDSPSSSQETIHPTDDYETPKIEEYTYQMSIDWGVYEVSLGYQFCTGKTYPVSYSFRDIDKEGATIYIDDTSICSVEETDSGFNLTAHKAGNTYIRILDRNGITHYQQILEVRTTVPQEQMVNFLIEVDHYDTWTYYKTYSDLQIVFLSENQAMIQGTDEGTDIGTVYFNYALSEETPSTHEYRFDISNWEATSTTWSPFCFYVDMNGNWIHVMSGTEDTAVSVPFEKILTE